MPGLGAVLGAAGRWSAQAASARMIGSHARRRKPGALERSQVKQPRSAKPRADNVANESTQAWWLRLTSVFFMRTG
jgi:hypothetical protein